MPHPLDGAWARLQRGREHLDAFNTLYIASAEGPDAPGVAFSEELDRRYKRWVVRFMHGPPIPELWMLLIEDAIRNYRSALDHLIWELRFIDSKGVDLGMDDHSQFPIVTAGPKEFERRKRAWLPGVSPSHVAAIKRFQPYRGGNPEDINWNPLRLLNNLDNDAKHRLVHIGTLAAADIKIAFPYYGVDCHRDTSRPLGGRSVAGRALKPKAVVAYAPLVITGPKPNMHVEFKASAYIGFGNGIPVKEGLESIERRVVEIIMEFAADMSSDAAIAIWKPRRSRVDRMRVGKRSRGWQETIHQGRPTF